MTHENTVDGSVYLRQGHRKDTCPQEVPHRLRYQIRIAGECHFSKQLLI